MADSAREIVLKRWPKAFAYGGSENNFFVFKEEPVCPTNEIGRGATESEAWERAAKLEQ